MIRTSMPWIACLTVVLACGPLAHAQPFEDEIGDALKKFKGGLHSQAAKQGPAPKIQPKEVPNQQPVVKGVSVLADQALVDVIAKVTPSVVVVKTETGMGTGFIVDPAGLIVTNAHVVGGAEPGTMVAIATSDKQVVPGLVIAVGDLERRGKDIALIMLQPGKQYPALSFADSKNVMPGRAVIAIGHPKGLAFSVSQGMISAVERRMPGSVMTYIQTDTSMNPGNSGGPLLSLDGKVVGMSTQILTESGGSEGLGFAINAADVQEALEQFKRTEDLSVGYMGAPLMPDKERNTIVIQDVARNGPAEKAGLQAGDSIIEIDGQSIVSSPDEAVNKLLRILAFKSAGEAVKVAVMRADQRVDVTVTLGEWPVQGIMASLQMRSRAPVRGLAALGF